MSETSTLHFTIGEDFGVMLMNIAQEHLLYNLDPEKALKTITDSLMGCPEELGLQILNGDMVLPVDEDTQEVICVPREDKIHDEYPKLNIKDWCERQAKDIEKRGYELDDALIEITIKATNKSINKSFDYRTIIEFLAGNDKELREQFLEIEEVSELDFLLTITRQYIEKSMKTINVMKWAHKNLPISFFHDDHQFILSNVMQDLKILLETQKVEERISKVDPMLDNYLNAVRENDEKTNEGLVPVDILENYSAGWLSPKGDYYALNGELANMLHIEIADALKEQGVIPKNDMNPDGWLEQQGWMKIHGDLVQHAGCLNAKLDKPVVNISDKQKEIVYDYIQKCHEGIMRLGWKMTKISAARFEMTDVHMLNKDYFSFD